MADDFPDDTGDLQADTRFKPGSSGNPNGRPRAAAIAFHKRSLMLWRTVSTSMAQRSLNG